MNVITITYKERKLDRQLLVDLQSRRWIGDDPLLVEQLNHSIPFFLGVHAYYPTPWHEIKAVADKLKGTVDVPEPVVERDPEKIY